MKGKGLTFKISETTNIYNSVVNSFKYSGFRMTAYAGWNCLWTGSVKPEFFKDLKKY
jgi:hypothetical protein